MKNIDFEDEIAILESALSYLEMAMQDIVDSPYHSHLKETWELDADEIQARLDELYMLQDDIYRNEMLQQNIEFEEGRL